MANNPAQWLSTSEAAKRLNVSPRTVRRRCERGEIGARLIGGVWEVDGASIGGDRKSEEAKSVVQNSAQPINESSHAVKSADSRTRTDGHAVTDTRTVGQGAGTDLNASADRSADSRTDGRGQSDTDTRPGGQTDSDRLTARLLTQLETENSFLRATVEQLQRDGAETRAALREALKMAPKQLTAGTQPPEREPEPTEAPQRDERDVVSNQGATVPSGSTRRGAGLALVRDGIKRMFAR
jgi:excisionase family DNA binding protein